MREYRERLPNARVLGTCQNKTVKYMVQPTFPFLFALAGRCQKRVRGLNRGVGGMQFLAAIFDHAGAFGFARFKVELKSERVFPEESLIPTDGCRCEAGCSPG